MYKEKPAAEKPSAFRFQNLASAHSPQFFKLDGLYLPSGTEGEVVKRYNLYMGLVEACIEAEAILEGLCDGAPDASPLSKQANEVTRLLQEVIAKAEGR